MGRHVRRAPGAGCVPIPTGDTVQDRDEPETEMVARLKRFVGALDGGTHDDLEACCRLLVAQVTDDSARLWRRFSLDPVRNASRRARPAGTR